MELASGVPRLLAVPRKNDCGWMGGTKRQGEQHKPVSKEEWEICSGDGTLRDVTQQLVAQSVLNKLQTRPGPGAA